MAYLSEEDLAALDERLLPIHEAINELRSRFDHFIDAFSKEDRQSDELEQTMNKAEDTIRRLNDRLEKVDRHLDEMERKLK